MKKRKRCYSGLRHNRMKNTNSKIKHIQMPCLVETEALFGEDRCLSLQEWASVWKIQRLWVTTQRPCLVKQIGCIVFYENTKTEFYMFQTDICLPKHLFLSLKVWQNQFYIDLFEQWGLWLANTNICLKT